MLPTRLAHLPDAVGAEDGRRLGEDGLRLRERLAVAAVERADDLARQLEVGGLVPADRHERRLVDDDVGRLQDGVGQQAVVDVVGLLLDLLLVGRRPLQPADRRDRRRAATPARCAPAGGSGRTACSAPDRGRGRAAPAAISRVRCAEDVGVVGARQRVVVDDAVDRLVLALAARRSCGSRPGRCRGGRCPTAGSRRRSAAGSDRRERARLGAAAASVVAARERRRCGREVGRHGRRV